MSLNLMHFDSSLQLCTYGIVFHLKIFKQDDFFLHSILENNIFIIKCLGYLLNKYFRLWDNDTIESNLANNTARAYILRHGFRNIGQLFRNAGPCSQNEVK